MLETLHSRDWKTFIISSHLNREEKRIELNDIVRPFRPTSNLGSIMYRGWQSRSVVHSVSSNLLARLEPPNSYTSNFQGHKLVQPMWWSVWNRTPRLCNFKGHIIGSIFPFILSTYLVLGFQPLVQPLIEGHCCSKAI